jgi:hypothetical protein
MSKYQPYRTSVWAEYRKKRARDGLCYSCKEPRTDGIYCAKHKAYFKAHDARMRDRKAPRKEG